MLDAGSMGVHCLQSAAHIGRQASGIRKAAPIYFQNSFRYSKQVPGVFVQGTSESEGFSGPRPPGLKHGRPPLKSAQEKYSGAFLPQTRPFWPFQEKLAEDRPSSFAASIICMVRSIFLQTVPSLAVYLPFRNGPSATGSVSCFVLASATSHYRSCCTHSGVMAVWLNVSTQTIGNTSTLIGDRWCI